MLEGRLSDQAMEYGAVKTTENINQISLFAVTTAFTTDIYIRGRKTVEENVTETLTESVEQTKYLHAQNHI